MTDYTADIRRYTPDVNSAAVDAVVRYCGIALQKTDSSLVATRDPDELKTVRDGFAAKKLGLSAGAADAGIKAVTLQMKDDHRKHRVTFYYLLAQATGTLDKLA